MALTESDIDKVKLAGFISQCETARTQSSLLSDPCADEREKIRVLKFDIKSIKSRENHNRSLDSSETHQLTKLQKKLDIANSKLTDLQTARTAHRDKHITLRTLLTSINQQLKKQSIQLEELARYRS